MYFKFLYDFSLEYNAVMIVRSANAALSSEGISSVPAASIPMTSKSVHAAK